MKDGEQLLSIALIKKLSTRELSSVIVSSSDDQHLRGCSCHKRDSNAGSEAQAAALLLPPIDGDPIFRHLCLFSVPFQRRGYFGEVLAPAG